MDDSKVPFERTGHDLMVEKDEDAIDYNADALRTDARDMKRLGKKQEFKRNFGLWSALGFVSIYMATWEFVSLSSKIASLYA